MPARCLEVSRWLPPLFTGVALALFSNNAPAAPALAPAPSLSASSRAATSDDPWQDFQIIMWQPHTQEQYLALKRLGVTGGEVIADRSDRSLAQPGDPLLLADPERGRALLEARLPWYVDNIATDFYSPYHFKSSNAAFQKVRRLYEANPEDIAALTREPSLSDPVWMEKIRTRITRAVQANRPFAPLFYNLADEPGIAETCAAWDFDFSPSSLAAMRQWLHEQYGSLAALNREWGSRFQNWDEVMPATTAQVLRRTDGNFSSWADFKAWMDIAFARAVRMGSDAVHAVDPDAYAAITGAQTPGPGGYDYSLLSDAVDLIEPYDLGGSVDIIHSLNSKTVIVTTSFVGGEREAHHVWRELIHGTRGLILWEDPDKKFLREDGSLDKRGREAAPYFGELRSGLGALMIGSRPAPASVAILYSPASMRTQWILDWQPKSDAWSRNGTSSWAADNGVNLFLSLSAHAGVEHQIVTPAMIEKAVLRRGRWRVLVLPNVLAMSSAEAAAIRDFVRGGGTVIADREPALYDQHSRRLSSPALGQIFRSGPSATATFPFGKGKGVYFVPERASAVLAFKRLLKESGIEPALTLVTADGETPTDLDIQILANGGVMIAALQRDLPALGDNTSRSGSTPEDIFISLPRPAYVYDLRKKSKLGQISSMAVSLGTIEPALFAISDSPLPAPKIFSLAKVRSGDTVPVHISLDGPTSASFHILHLDVISPGGELVLDDSRNVWVHASGSKRLTLPPRGELGTWRLRVTDVLSGRTAETDFEVARE